MAIEKIPNESAVKTYIRKTSVQWQNDVPYRVGDIRVSSIGELYRCVQDHNLTDLT